MVAHKILLAEDEAHLRFSLKFNLESEGYEVVEAENGLIALEKYKSEGPYATILLDVQMPEMNGFDVAKKIRSEDSKTQILMLTARAADEDRVSGLKAGVDDYITKPFHLQELLLRIKRMVERSEILARDEESTKELNNLREIGALKLHYDRLLLEFEDRNTNLTALEADCLAEFIDHANTVLTREFLLEKVWKVSGHQETRTVDNCIMRLRKHLEALKTDDVELESIRGRGYQLTVRSL